jgi:hypothetical protein
VVARRHGRRDALSHFAQVQRVEVQRVEAVLADVTSRAADAAVLAEQGVGVSWSPDESATASASSKAPTRA